MTKPFAACPMALELASVTLGAGRGSGFRIGIGRSAAAAAAARASRLGPGAPIAIVGLGGGLDADLRPGDLVVASAVFGEGPPRALPGAGLLAAELLAAGLSARAGGVLSSPRPLWGRARRAAAGTGAAVVDMESAWALGGLGERPVAVLRAVADTQGAGPLELVRSGLVALGSLSRAAPLLRTWAQACGPGEVEVAAPGSEPFGGRADLLLVLAAAAGSRGGKSRPAPQRLLADPGALRLGWLVGKKRIGIVSDDPASAEVGELVALLGWLGRRSAGPAGIGGPLLARKEVG